MADCVEIQYNGFLGMSSEILSPVSQGLIDALAHEELKSDDPKIQVNRFVSEIASWYEKLRNAMDYRDDEVVLRAAIERILKRRHLYGGTGKTIAEPLVRELVWARYFPNNSLPENITLQVTHIIDLYLHLRANISAQKILTDKDLNEWIYQLASCQIARLLSPNQDKNIMSNFMFHILKDSLTIEDDSPDTKNVQMYLAVRRAFARDDIAFLRYYLFQQIYGEVSAHNVAHISSTFEKGYAEMQHQLNYKLKEKILLFVKKQTPVFFILEDVLRTYRSSVHSLLQTSDDFEKVVYAACDIRYKSISSKVKRALVRSVIFLLLTKVFFAFAVEGTYDNYVYGHIIWLSLILNMGIPPLLMVFVSLFIRTPGADNSKRIIQKIHSILYDEHPKITYNLTLEVNKKKNKSLMNTIFGGLWLFAFVLSFGLIVYGLTKLQFNPVSQVIFIFFVTIVSFLSYRINTTAHMYTIEERQSMLTPFVDFLFLPIIRVGMKFTEGVSKINVFIYIFDFLIEAPFKGIFAFFEQWFLYLHTKREDLE